MPFRQFKLVIKYIKQDFTTEKQICVLYFMCCSGVISTAVSFDREKQREYTLSVTATDQAQEPLIGICQITVLIADQNDNDPKFENSRYQCKYCVYYPY